MDISFTINGKPFQVTPKTVPVETSLNTYIRNYANLSGTKFMCLEGGCGACIVTIQGAHPVTKERTTWAVNSCLFPLYSCHNLDVTTIEGIGNKKDGYHKVQSRLAQFNGSQCGYCSPGMAMNMYSLLESKNGKVTMEEVENSFGGNICRCTGYRPILDAFKSLAVDADEKLLSLCNDIEDVPKKTCPKTGNPCGGKCESANKSVHLTSNDDKEWHKVYTVQEIFDVLDKSGTRPYMLVAGNTAHGVYRRDKNLEVFIDINGITELRVHSIGDSLEFGGNVSLTECMEILKIAADKPEFSYCTELFNHIDLIANVPVRSGGTIAGNLSIKHQHEEFPSDLWLIFEAVGAKLTIFGSGGQKTICSPEEYLELDMDKKIILKISLPKLDATKQIFKSYKIMPRAQNAHAYVNSGFLFEFNSDKTKVLSARICFGGINPKFTHATATETLIVGKNIFTNETLKTIFKSLSEEIDPDWVLPDASPEYRKNLALSLFYKYVLDISPTGLVKSEYLSGGSILERGLSSGTQTFDTYKENWPLTKNIQKIEGNAQTSGEAMFVNDLPRQPNELWGAFVLATKCHYKIVSFDTAEALKVKGVHSFISAKDIPGNNNFNADESVAEQLLCDGNVLFSGQPCGIILADSFDTANHAVSLVKIAYDKTEKTKVFSSMKEVLESKETDRIVAIAHFSRTATEHGKEAISESIKGRFEIGGQYHYTMEPQTCVCIPVEDGIDVYSATQWIDKTQTSISKLLNVRESTLNMEVRRLGGAYGGKITRASQIACAAALACHLTNRPIRFVLTLEANMTAIGKRFALLNDYEVDFDVNGKIQKLKNTYYQEHGCSMNEPVQHSTSGFFRNCYDDRSWDVLSNGILTDAPAHTWCRAPGTTEGIAMIENIMEHISRKSGKTPVEVRLANMPDGIEMKKIYLDFLKSIEFEKRRIEVDSFNAANRWKKRGIATTPMRYSLGYFGTMPAVVSIYHGDGSVAITHGGIEMGQGLNTKVVQVAAHTLGIPMELIKIKPALNSIVPNAICSGGSSASDISSYAVKKACEKLLERMKPIKDEKPEATWAEIVAATYGKNIELQASYMYKGGDLKNYDIWGVSCAETEIDLLTGNLQLRRVDILEDTGESMSPGIDIGQVEGSFIMGMGYWLTESLIYNRENGDLLTNRTWNYKPPGAKDIPIDFRITFLQKSSNPVGVLRSKATGEPAVCMSIVVILALRDALNSARKDAGLKDEWYNLGAPTTVEDTFIIAGTNFEQFSL